MANETSTAMSVEEFETLYEAYSTRLVYALMKPGRISYAIAEDAAQEAWIKLYNTYCVVGAGPDKLPDSVKSWLYRIARNKYLDIATHEAKLKSIIIDKDAPSEGGRDEYECEYKQEILVLLGTLPERQRETFSLLLDDFTVEEVAEIMDVSTETVRSNLRHARKRLKKEVSNRAQEVPYA